MIYYIIRPIARLGCLIYFRKIFLLNVEALPKKGPLLLVCNHPSSFFEACLLAVTLPRALYFLTRGDFFKNSTFAWFLRQTHQIPIFRAKDGFDKLRNNQDTFAYCYNALHANKAILIFPEAYTVLEKRLRPIQKGAARIALGSLTSISDINILPIGVTFSNPMKFRSHVTVHVGNAIHVTKPETPEEERNTATRITEEIETSLRRLLIHIDRPEREPVFDAMQRIAFNQGQVAAFPVVSSADTFPREEMRIAARINAMHDDALKDLRSKINTYSEALEANGIRDQQIHAGKNNFITGIIRLLTLPLFLLGKAVFYIPLRLIRNFLRKKMKSPPYHGPVKWVLGFFGLAIWFILCTLIGWLFGGTSGLVIALLCLMCGYSVLIHYHDYSIKAWLAPLRIRPEKTVSLKQMRREILESV